MPQQKSKKINNRRTFLQGSSLAGAAIAVQSGGAKAKKKMVIQGELKEWKKIADRKGLEEAFRFLENPQLKTLPEGKHTIRGEQIYAVISRPSTRKPEEAKYEAHQKYIDIQFLLEGEEEIRIAPVQKLKETTPYDAAKDIAFYEHPATFEKAILRSGCFVVLYPEDAHLPLCRTGKAEKVYKVVVKVSVESSR